MGQYDGTKIGADGKRYDEDDPALAEATAPARQHYQIHGTPNDGDTVVFKDGRLEFISVDDLAAYTPGS